MNFEFGDVIQTPAGLIGLVVGVRPLDDTLGPDEITVLWKDATVSHHIVDYKIGGARKIGTGRAEVEIIWSK